MVKSDLTRLSRRDVLRAAAAIGGSLALPRAIHAGPPASQPAASQPATAPSSDRKSDVAKVPPPWWLGPDYPRSRVVELHSAAVLDGMDVDEPILAEMLGKGLRILTGQPTAGEAWRQILGDRRRIVIKFNGVGADALRISTPMARTLVGSLVESGIRAEDLTLVEAPPPVVRELGVREPKFRWGPAVEVADGEEPLADWLYEADAVINVPFLKAHRIAGLSGAMKNLSHALLRRPAKYHANGCSPYVGQVIGSSAVSSRLRLNVMNAIRVVHSDGPEAHAGNVSETGSLLLGFDPVAVDETGYGLLVSERTRQGRHESLAVPYLLSAAEMEVGRREAHELERIRVEDPW